MHLPSPSYWPLVLALGLPVIGYALIFNLWFLLLGGALVIAGIYGWILEPPDDPEAPHDEHENGEHGEHGGEVLGQLEEGSESLVANGAAANGATANGAVGS